MDRSNRPWSWNTGRLRRRPRASSSVAARCRRQSLALHGVGANAPDASALDIVVLTPPPAEAPRHECGHPAEHGLEAHPIARVDTVECRRQRAGRSRPARSVVASSAGFRRHPRSATASDSTDGTLGGSLERSPNNANWSTHHLARSTVFTNTPRSSSMLTHPSWSQRDQRLTHRDLAHAERGRDLVLRRACPRTELTVEDQLADVRGSPLATARSYESVLRVNASASI